MQYTHFINVSFNREFLTGMDAAKEEAEAIKAKEAELAHLEQLRDAQYSL